MDLKDKSQNAEYTSAPDGGEEQDPDPRGWDAITEAFEKLYPGQDDPIHLAPRSLLPTARCSSSS